MISQVSIWKTAVTLIHWPQRYSSELTWQASFYCSIRWRFPQGSLYSHCYFFFKKLVNYFRNNGIIQRRYTYMYMQKHYSEKEQHVFAMYPGIYTCCSFFRDHVCFWHWGLFTLCHCYGWLSFLFFAPLPSNCRTGAGSALSNQLNVGLLVATELTCWPDVVGWEKVIGPKISRQLSCLR